MSSAPPKPSLFFRGRLPSESQPICSCEADAGVVKDLDCWLSRTMELLELDPHWGEEFDEVPPSQFALLGTRGRTGLAGHLTPSRDSQGRRFPFVVASSFVVEEPMGFLGTSALSLSQLWVLLESASMLAYDCETAAEVQEVFSKAERRLHDPARTGLPLIRDFLETQTIGSLEALLEGSGQRVSLSRTLRSLGLLLLPISHEPSQRPVRGVVLPLVNDPLYRPFVASFWLDLIAGFVRNAALELVVLTTRVHGIPSLVVGFNGPCPRLLRTVLAPKSWFGCNITFDGPARDEEAMNNDYLLSRITSSLRDPGLSLTEARSLFSETFFYR
jgi:type VI secretion system protein ImpM